MTRVPEKDRDILEQAMYLPMLLTILERDRILFDKGSFKLKQPYLELIDETITAVQYDLKKTKDAMRKGQMKVEEITRDEAFTMFLFIYKGYEEKHNYFNPRIRNRVQELMEFYLYKRFK
jgi:hypothetical protein